MRYCACGYDRHDDCQQHECHRYTERKEHIMKSENYIVINGKKAELTEEQLKALGLTTEIKNPFSRVNDGEHYYAICYNGKIERNKEMTLGIDDQCFEVANYCTDREMMEQRALHETLNRLLWRYSMEHKGNEIEWTHGVAKYSIYWGYITRKWKVAHDCNLKIIGTPYFYSKETAENAIKEIIEPFMAEHPDFKF